jgi:hypothetical protein
MTVFQASLALMLAISAGAAADHTFWPNTAKPKTATVMSEKSSATVGLRFSSDVAGSIRAVRFYKGKNNKGTHAGQIWDASGAKLAEVTFTAETASGWQQASFASPVSIAANTMYVVSYVAPNGAFARDEFYTWPSVVATPLRVSGSSPGVFSYGSGAVFPTDTRNQSNFWVDVVFVPASAPAPTYSISGKVSGSAATVALSGAAARSTTTDSLGNYTFTGLSNGSYIVTPSQSGYTFSPVSSSVSIAGASVSGVNFTGSTTAPVTYNISGKVSGSVATVVLSGAAGRTTTTDSLGNYTFTGLSNGSYIVTPSQSGYAFSPVSSSVSIAGASVSGVNFTATSTAPTTYSISGKVSGSAAMLTLSGTSGGTTTTDGTGNYTFSGLSNGSYVVAPSQSGYAFSPSTASVSISGSSLSGINFNSTAVVTHTVSLNWVASTSTDVLGYNVYRSTTAGGPYTKLTGSVVAGTAYVDNNVAAGQTYYYVATAVAGSDSESEYSTQATATVPTP